MILCALFLFSTFISVYAIKFTFLSVLVSVAGIVYPFALFYYRLKYIFDDEGNILDNINFLDKKLETIGIKLPYRRNAIETLVLPFAYILLNVAISYKNIKYFKVPTYTELINLVGLKCFVVSSCAVYCLSLIHI